MHKMGSGQKKYLGAYCQTQEFRFQETVRKLDVELYEKVKGQFFKEDYDRFLSNGWSDIISAAYLLEIGSIDLTISETFLRVVASEIKEACEKAKYSSNPLIEVNVRDHSKSILMYPHSGSFLPFQKVDYPEAIIDLNQFVKKSSCSFEYDTKWDDICFMIDLGIFDKLFESTNFLHQLEGLGFKKFERPKFKPHITLVSSDDLPKIKALFNERHGLETGTENLMEFLKLFIERRNEQIKREASPIIFTELASTFCEDYAPYKEVIVARFKGPAIEETVKQLLDDVEKQLGKRPEIKINDGLHLTLAVRFRKPAEVFEAASIEAILNDTGPFKKEFNIYWESFQS